MRLFKSKKLFCLVLSLILCIATTTLAMASENVTEAKDVNVFELISENSSKVITQNYDDYTKYIIEDENIINKISAIDESIPKGEKVVRIEYVYIPSPEEKTTDTTVTPAVLPSAEIRNIKSYGHGWYNKDDDLIHRYAVDGPDTFKVSETAKYKATCTTKVSGEAKVVSASIGFEIGGEYQVGWESNTPVPAGQRLIANVYRTYLKKSYEYWTKPFLGNWKKSHNGWAYKPTGTFIQKTFLK